VVGPAKPLDFGRVPPDAARVMSMSGEQQTGEPGGAVVARGSARGWVLAIILVTALAYLPAFYNDFTNADDPAYVHDNPLIRSLSCRSVWAMFTQFHEGYHPLTMLSLAFDYALGGLHPAPYHLTNILLHLLNVALVYLLVSRLSGSRGAGLIAAALFGVNPVHVESVAWIPERKNVLYALFFLLSLLAYLRYLRASRWCWYTASLGLSLLALLANGKAISLAPTLVALDFQAGRRLLGRRALAEKAPFFLLAVVFGLVNLVAQKQAGYLYSVVDFQPWEHALVAGRSLLAYAALVVRPVNLTHQYPYPARIGGHLPWDYLLSPLGVALAAAVVLWSLRHGRIWLTAALFYALNIAPVLKFVPFAGVMMEDHFVYVPSIGILLLLGLLYRRGLAGGPAAGRVARAGLGLHLLLLAALTYQRSQVWRNGVTLWSDVLARYPNSPRGWLNRGAARGVAGDTAGALCDYRRALEITPRNGIVHYNIGNILLSAGDAMAAVKAYNTAARLCPDFAAIYYYRAVAKEQMGSLPGALDDYDRAIAMRHFSARSFPHFRRGALKVRLGRWSEAIPDFDATLRQFASSDAHYYRAFARARTGDRSGALADLRQAVRLSADCPPDLKGFFDESGLMAEARGP
jgi:tetratricopeptide (TPR) repeat protein